MRRRERTPTRVLASGIHTRGPGTTPSAARELGEPPGEEVSEIGVARDAEGRDEPARREAPRPRRPNPCPPTGARVACRAGFEASSRIGRLHEPADYAQSNSSAILDPISRTL